MRSRGKGGGHLYFDEPLDALDAVLSILRPGDLFLTMGAGDNWRLGVALYERLRASEKSRMLKSMTGFAHRDLKTKGMRGNIELKSYNNRYMDLSISVPPYLSRLEPRFREYISSRVRHGKVELWLRIRELDVPVAVSADIAAASAVSKVLADIAAACGIQEAPRLGNILSFDGVVSLRAGYRRR